MRNNKNIQKICPMLDKPCLKTGCQIYNTRLENCEISILTYNLYLLKTALEKKEELTQE